MKKFFLFFLLCCFSLGYAKPLPPSVEELARKALSAAQLRTLSHNATADLIRRLKRMPQVRTNPRQQFNPNVSPSEIPTVQVQLHAYSVNTASATPIMIDGRKELFFATHWAEEIKKDPHVKVTTPNGEVITAPIQKMYSAHKRGLDLTVFRAPEEIEPFITALEPAEYLAEAGTPVNISGFAHESPTLLPEETVLFASPVRYVIQMRNPKMLGGICGGTITDPVTGEVIAIEQGYNYMGSALMAQWFQLLPRDAQENLTDVHFAIPIQNAVAVARAFESGDDSLAAIEMKVLGRPVALLYPDEYIFSVSLMRDGIEKQTIHFNPFLNPQKLEEFFNLEPNDVLRIVVERGTSGTKKAQTIYYDVNVSTGKVTMYGDKK